MRPQADDLARRGQALVDQDALFGHRLHDLQREPVRIDREVWLALQVVEAMTDNAILVDEGLTSSRQIIGLTAASRPATGYHALASGGIGWGLPADAAAGQRVVAVAVAMRPQADDLARRGQALVDQDRIVGHRLHDLQQRARPRRSIRTGSRCRSCEAMPDHAILVDEGLTSVAPDHTA
ncbi:hypothetical protein [Bradyrhizobium elkanii]|uniref:hypothetical protein n=1 Tax=Bradyrhizobium elkanii TaxID=29448 RepID=UPI003516EE35